MCDTRQSDLVVVAHGAASELVALLHAVLHASVGLASVGLASAGLASEARVAALVARVVAALASVAAVAALASTSIGHVAIASLLASPLARVVVVAALAVLTAVLALAVLGLSALVPGVLSVLSVLSVAAVLSHASTSALSALAVVAEVVVLAAEESSSAVLGSTVSEAAVPLAGVVAGGTSVVESSGAHGGIHLAAGLLAAHASHVSGTGVPLGVGARAPKAVAQVSKAVLLCGARSGGVSGGVVGSMLSGDVVGRKGDSGE